MTFRGKLHGRRSGIWHPLAGCQLVCALLLWGASGATSYAGHAARLFTDVEVKCDGRNAEARVEVKNVGDRPVVLTQALFYLIPEIPGQEGAVQPTPINLLETQGDTAGAPTQVDSELSPGEQKAQAMHLTLVEGVEQVHGILMVHVKGETGWRILVDLDSCR